MSLVSVESTCEEPEFQYVYRAVEANAWIVENYEAYKQDLI